MALHNKRYNVQEENWQTNENKRHDHLQRFINPTLASKFVGRGPEQKGGTTVVALPYPVFNDEDKIVSEGKVVDDRWDPNPENPSTYNRWLFKANDRGIVRFGKQWLSCLFDNPDDSGWNFDDDHPIQLIYKHISFAVNKKINAETPYGSANSDAWAILLKGDGGTNYAVIKRPDTLYAFFSLIYSSGKDNFFSQGAPFGSAPADPIPVFIMSRDLANSFIEEMNKPLRNDQPAAGLLHPNVTGCKYIHIYDKQQGGCPAMRAAMAQVVDTDVVGGMRRGPSSQTGEQAHTGFGYSAHISDTLDGSASGRRIGRDSHAKFATKRLQPWHNVLRGYTPEEVADLVQDVCKLPLSVLDYAWSTHPEFLNETTKNIMKAKLTSIPSVALDKTQAPRRSMIEEQGEMNWDNVAAPQADPITPPDTATVQDAPPASVYDPKAQQSIQDKLRAAMKGSGTGGPKPAASGSFQNPPPFRPDRPAN